MITRNRILFIVGLWTILVPFLGFPSAYKTFFTIASGLAVVVLAFLYARDKRMSHIHEHSQPAEEVEVHEVTTEVFAQNFPIFTQKEQSIESRYTDIEELRSRSRLKTF